MNAELEEMVLRRTGKRLGELNMHEFDALIQELKEEGRAHQAHSDELNDFLERRSKRSDESEMDDFEAEFVRRVGKSPHECAEKIPASWIKDKAEARAKSQVKAREIFTRYQTHCASKGEPVTEEGFRKWVKANPSDEFTKLMLNELAANELIISVAEGSIIYDKTTDRFFNNPDFKGIDDEGEPETGEAA